MALHSELRIPTDKRREIVSYVDHTELTANSTSQTIDLGQSLPAGAVLDEVEVQVLTAFVRASATSATVKVGHASDDDAYATAVNVLATGRSIPGGAAAERTPTAAKPLKALITADQNLGNGTITSFTAGRLVVRAWYREPESVA